MEIVVVAAVVGLFVVLAVELCAVYEHHIHWADFDIARSSRENHTRE